jgi:hypothetical protein
MFFNCTEARIEQLQLIQESQSMRAIFKCMRYHDLSTAAAPEGELTTLCSASDANTLNNLPIVRCRELLFRKVYDTAPQRTHTVL